MTKIEAKEKAIQNFKSGLNCAQSVCAVFAEELDFDTDLIKKISQPFGAGMSRMRETCGAVSALLLLLGILKGSCEGDKAKKDEIYKDGQKLMNEFKNKNGSYICSELTKLKANGSVSEERTSEYYKKRPCAELCAQAAEIFYDFLNEN